MSLENDLYAATDRLNLALAYAEKHGELRSNIKDRIMNDLTDIVGVLVKMRGNTGRGLAGWSTLLHRVERVTLRGAVQPMNHRSMRHRYGRF